MKRIFAKEKDTNYNDYLKIKKGLVQLNNVYKRKEPVLHKFIDYNSFLTLSHSYYYQKNKEQITTKPPVCILDATESYIYHKNDESCLKTNDVENNCCKQLKHVLYPYGKRKTNTDFFYFPNNIVMTRYCNSSCKSIENVENFENLISEINIKKERVNNAESIVKPSLEPSLEPTLEPSLENVEITPKIKKKDPEVL